MLAGVEEGFIFCCNVARDVFKSFTLEVFIFCKFYFCPSSMGPGFIFTWRG